MSHISQPLDTTLTEAGDAPADNSTPYTMNVGDTFHGNIAGIGDHDRVAISLEAGTHYSIAMRGMDTGAGTLSGFYLDVYDDTGTKVTGFGNYNSDHYNPREPQVVYFEPQVVYTPTRSAVYYLDASGFHSDTGTYAMSADISRTVGDTIYGAQLFDAQATSGVAVTINDQGGWDTLDFSYTTAADRIDLSPGAYSDIGGQSGNLGIAIGTQIEEAIGGSGNDTINGNLFRNLLIGNDGADTLRGDLGDDTLQGGNGNDRLIGGAGADHLDGGAGADYLDGGAGQDVAIYADAARGVTADLLNTARNSGDAAGDRYFSIEDLIGSHHGDTLAGNNGNNMLRGGDGNDVIHGRGGGDYIDGGAGNDRLFGMNGSDRLYGMDGDDMLTGGASNDRLVGGAGNDRLFGGAANDRLDGGTGHDYLNGGAGNDWLLGNGGYDRLYGGDGFDLLKGGYGNDRMYGGAGNDTMYGGVGDDRLYGGNGDDNMDGGDFRTVRDWGNDRLIGGAGNDRMYGGAGAGNDRMFGGAGSDRMDGGDGNDLMHGDAGNDVLNGGAGNDRITGGAGNDYIRGGLGADIFLFHSGDGHDDIVDFTVSQNDRLFISAGLTGGMTDAASVLSHFASVTDAGVELAFDDGTTITLDDLTSTAGLADHILITG